MRGKKARLLRKVAAHLTILNRTCKRLQRDGEIKVTASDDESKIYYRFFNMATVIER